MAYRYVLFDFDHTLLDSDTSLELAFADAMRAVGADPDGRYELFDEINGALWRQVEAGTMSAPQVHLTRFEQLNVELGLGVDPVLMANTFAPALGARGELYEGARVVLDQLATVATLGLVTNGLSEVQRARIDRLDLHRYFDAVIISAEVGAFKPGREIFELAFAALDHPVLTEMIMVGDSLSSDIAGGNNAGIATCWYNPRRMATDPAHVATYEIGRLSELVPIVTGP